VDDGRNDSTKMGLNFTHNKDGDSVPNFSLLFFAAPFPPKIALTVLLAARTIAIAIKTPARAYSHFQASLARHLSQPYSKATIRSMTVPG
jgi:hypothetical protein